MKKYKFSIVAIISGMLILGSCSEDILDVPALGRYVGDPDPNAPMDYAMVNGEAIGLYSYVNMCYNNGWGYSTYVTLNVASDDAVSGGASAGDRPEYEAAEKFTLDPNNQGTIALFSRFYGGVAKCNKFLDSYPERDKDTVLRCRAEAKFLRAFYYFYLVNLYGDIPLPLSSTAPGDLPQVPRDTVYAQIEKDLLEAINDLPASKADLTPDDLLITRATKNTARALLGKVYVYHSTMLGANKWAEAKAQLDAVVNSGEYQLVSDFRSLWSSTNEMKDGNPENIFEAYYTDEFGWGWSGVPRGNLDMQLMGIRDLTNYPGLDGGWGFCRPTKKLVDAFISENDSIRLDVTVVAEDWPDVAKSWETQGKLHKSLKTAGATYSDPYDGTGYWNGKYRQDEHPINAQMYAQNEIIMRYAEVLLLLAEAEYRLGNEAKARDYMNQIRARVKLPAKNSSGEQLWNDIVKEKQMELALESVRYWDLIRWGTAATEIPGFRVDRKGLWPFPLNQLAVDPNLKQNPGY
ncbi:MAG: RagB/SusD family nutrient uptake outer membrane protein [Bacteroidales bacterium]|nr:RagB/SusD family nutrient uptake outer membrane protein [Bacteroidales bacterium]HPO64444.1 RagB/SusD family nutrient uptake outer membrane protein [Bacteroidales bacterium]